MQTKSARPLLILTAIVNLLQLACAPASAQQVLDATFFFDVNGRESTSGPGVVNYFGTNVTASGVITQGVDPYVAASVTTKDVGGYAGADYDYYFEVAGPAGNVPVVVVANGLAQTTSATFYANASFQIPNLNVSEAATATPSSPASFSLNQSMNIPANTLEEVEIDAGVSIFLTGTASASVDPQITIDPTFANAGEYSLEFSPNFLAVPEPSIMALLPLGLGWLALRRKA
jgi:hypothetical protein